MAGPACLDFFRSRGDRRRLAAALASLCPCLPVPVRLSGNSVCSFSVSSHVVFIAFGSHCPPPPFVQKRYQRVEDGRVGGRPSVGAQESLGVPSSTTACTGTSSVDVPESLGGLHGRAPHLSSMA